MNILGKWKFVNVFCSGEIKITSLRRTIRVNMILAISWCSGVPQGLRCLAFENVIVCHQVRVGAQGCR